MKHMVSLLLLVAIVHADQYSSISKEEEENKTAKRTLLEGNFGLKIQRDTTEPIAEPQREYSRGNEQQNPAPFQKYVPTRTFQENGPPKISDVLTGQGPSFPAAIAGHLFAPSSVYQARLGSPTTFETVTSQLRFSRPFSALTSRPVFPEPFLLEPLQSQPIYSRQSIHSVYPLVKEFPPNLYQQINDLGNQLIYSGETYQYIQNSESEENTDADVKKNYQEAEKQHGNQEPSSTVRAPSASEDEPSITSQNQKPQQAVSYARFSQGFPLSSNEVQIPSRQASLQLLTSPEPLPQFQLLPQLQQTQLFRPLPQLQRSQLLHSHLHAQPIRQSTLQPPLQLLPVQQLQLNAQNQQNLKTRLFPLQPQSEEFLSSQQPFSSDSSNQVSSTDRQPPISYFPQNQENSIAQEQILFSPQPQNEQSLPSNQPEFTLPPKLSSFNQQSASTISQFSSSPQNKEMLSSRPQNQQTFSGPFQTEETLTTQDDNFFDSEPTEEYSKFNGLGNEVSTPSQTTESSVAPASVSILPKSHSTLINRPSSEPLPTTSSEFIFSSTSATPTLPPQSIVETTSSTLTPIYNPQPSLAPLVFAPQPQIVPDLPNVLAINTLESSPENELVFVTPQPTLQPYSITLNPLPQAPGIRAVPVQRYQVQSDQEPIARQVKQQQSSQVEPASGQVKYQPTTPTPFPQQLQIKLDQPDQQLQQSTQQLPSDSEQQKSQSQLQQQQSKLEQPQPKKEDAIAHAQQLLYEVYSPFRQPLYPETQNILLGQPQYKVPVAFPSNYVYPNYQASDYLISTQYFGNHAHEIFDRLYKKKK